MERNYFNKEFEQYIKSNADQYRMIPSEKVWKGINNTLHTRRKWYAIGFSVLLLLTAVSVTWVMLSYPSSNKQQVAATAKPPATKSQDKKDLPTVPVNPRQPVSALRSSNDINALLSIKRFDIPGDRSLTPAHSPLVVSESSAAVSESRSEVEVLPVPGRDHFLSNVVSPAIVSAKQQATANSSGQKTDAPIEGFSLLSPDERLLGNSSLPVARKSNKTDYNTTYLPFTIESVVNSYKPIRLPKKISWQIYAAPTVSYRRLTANRAYKSSGPFADPIVYPFTTLTDVNKAVKHKPDMGLELGFAARYPLSKSVRIKAGLQFNINRYDIRAYVYNREQATIDLNDANPVTAWTYYRNYNGYKSDWLKNFYFSVSAPIGAEWRLAGNDRTSFGIAGTVQPTYILRDRAYLISTDYKNYAEVPWLVRRMNVNTSFETFINFTSRNRTRWQVGPQVRYQVLSSYHNKYPVRENLFDFGLKMGVTLNQ